MLQGHAFLYLNFFYQNGNSNLGFKLYDSELVHIKWMVIDVTYLVCQKIKNILTK